MKITLLFVKVAGVSISWRRERLLKLEIFNIVADNKKVFLYRKIYET
jgi:hypothetical protein